MELNESVNKEKAAFVAGATGFTGREVVRLLLERGIKTIAHVRPDSPRLEEWKVRFTEEGAIFDSTPWQEETLKAAFIRIKPCYVFALLGTTRKRMGELKKAGRDPNEANYDAVDYGLTSLLIKASHSLETKPVFIYLSATGVTPSSNLPYYQARVKAEDELTKSGIQYVIARPAFITGKDREDYRPLERVGAVTIDSTLSVFSLLGAKKLSDRYHSTTNTKLAKALIEMAFNSLFTNKIVESDELQELYRKLS